VVLFVPWRTDADIRQHVVAFADKMANLHPALAAKVSNIELLHKSRDEAQRMRLELEQEASWREEQGLDRLPPRVEGELADAGEGIAQTWQHAFLPDDVDPHCPSLEDDAALRASLDWVGYHLPVPDAQCAEGVAEGTQVPGLPAGYDEPLLAPRATGTASHLLELERAVANGLAPRAGDVGDPLFPGPPPPLAPPPHSRPRTCPPTQSK
jgi:hypothetical protein